MTSLLSGGVLGSVNHMSGAAPDATFGGSVPSYIYAGARFGATAVKFVIALCAALGVAVVAAPAAAAEPSPVSPTHKTCGNWAGTCTQYWSVARTKEFNAEDKAKQNLKYAAAGAAGAAVGLTPAAPVGVAIGAFAGGKALMFEQAISSAANDGRCLIFKYPRGDEAAGWWGSVSASTNENCKKANEMDTDVFK